MMLMSLHNPCILKRKLGYLLSDYYSRYSDANWSFTRYLFVCVFLKGFIINVNGITRRWLGPCRKIRNIWKISLQQNMEIFNKLFEAKDQKRTTHLYTPLQQYKNYCVNSLMGYALTIIFLVHVKSCKIFSLWIAYVSIDWTNSLLLWIISWQT